MTRTATPRARRHRFRSSYGGSLGGVLMEIDGASHFFSHSHSRYSPLHMKVNATIFPFVLSIYAILDLEVHAERHCVCDVLSLSCAAHDRRLNGRPLYLAREVAKLPWVILGTPVLSLPSSDCAVFQRTRVEIFGPMQCSVPNPILRFSFASTDPSTLRCA